MDSFLKSAWGLVKLAVCIFVLSLLGYYLLTGNIPKGIRNLTVMSHETPAKKKARIFTEEHTVKRKRRAIISCILGDRCRPGYELAYCWRDSAGMRRTHCERF